jgi:hypothetical protein
MGTIQNSLFAWDPDGELSRNQIVDTLKPFQDRLCRCWLSAWDDWKTFVLEEGRARLDGLCCATCVNRFARVRALEEFADEAIFRADRALGFFKYYIGDRIVVRFKKLTRERLAMNVRTRQQRRWYRNIPMNGVRRGCTRLTIGYILAVTGEIEDVCVTFQTSPVTLGWWFSILGNAGTMEFPASPGKTPIPPTLIPKMGEAKDGGA